MLSKIKQIALYVLFGLLVLWWLISSSRRAGKRAAELKQKAKALDNVGKAHEVDKDIDNLDADAKRERLRKHK